jgi:hypothetical protein
MAKIVDIDGTGKIYLEKPRIVGITTTDCFLKKELHPRGAKNRQRRPATLKQPRKLQTLSRWHWADCMLVWLLMS